MITGLIALGSQRVAPFHVPSAVIHQLAARHALVISGCLSRRFALALNTKWPKSQQRRRCLFMPFIDLFMYLLYISSVVVNASGSMSIVGKGAQQTASAASDPPHPPGMTADFSPPHTPPPFFVTRGKCILCNFSARLLFKACRGKCRQLGERT